MSRRVLMIAFTRYRSDPRVRRLAEALVDRGDEVHCLCLHDQGQPADLNGVRLLGVANRHKGGFLRLLCDHLVFTFQAGVSAARRHLRHRYHVVHVHTMPDYLVLAALLPRLLGARVLLDIHDTVPELVSVYSGVGPTHPLVRFWRAVEVISSWFAHVVIAVHEPHRRRLVEHGVAARKLHVVMNLPDDRLFERGVAGLDQPGPPTIIYHGTLSRHLGLDLALDAASLLVEQGVAFRLRILGGGPLADDLAEAVRVRRLDGVVEVVGRYRPLDEIVGEIARADLGVIPCRSNAATELMLPTKLLEYVRLGIPCVATRTLTIGHYFDEEMVGSCRPDDSRDLARALRELLLEPQRRRALARSADRFNEVYSWTRHRQDYLRLIDGGAAPPAGAPRVPQEIPPGLSSEIPPHRETGARGLASVAAGRDPINHPPGE